MSVKLIALLKPLSEDYKKAIMEAVDDMVTDAELKALDVGYREGYDQGVYDGNQSR